MKAKRIGLTIALFLTSILSAATKNVTDDFISDTVMQRLAADAVVKGGDIAVDVKSGVVTLKGKVHDQKQKEKAERIAKKVAGVKSVVNGITIEKP